MVKIESGFFLKFERFQVAIGWKKGATDFQRCRDCRKRPTEGRDISNYFLGNVKSGWNVVAKSKLVWVTYTEI